MALIIKELIIKGIVTSDPSTSGEASSDQKALLQALEGMKKEIKEECLEMVSRKLEAKNGR